MNRQREEKISIKSLLPFIFLIIVVLVFLFPLPYYIEGPGSTENLKEFVTVNNKEDDESGGFYLTTVGVRQARIISLVSAYFSEFEEIVSKKELMGSSSNEEYNRMQKYYMDSSQNTAIEQALKLSDTPYEMTFKGIYVLSVDENSNFKDKISVGDTVTAIDGEALKSKEEFIQYVKSQKVGQEVTISYLQDGEKKEATEKLMKLPTDEKPGIGIVLTDHTEINSSIPIEIDAGAIGGPSAGLMFTLEAYELLTQKDLRKGKKIAGTGTIESDGSVGPIGGIDKKVVTANKNGAEIFFAPDNEITKEELKLDPEAKSNYQVAKETAEKINTEMKIIPVKSVTDALDYLEKMK